MIQKRFYCLLCAVCCVLVLMVSLASALPSRHTSSSDQEVKGLFAEGQQRQHEKRYAEAITAYRRALKLDPNQPETLNNIGFCYKEMKDYKNAVRYYKEAEELKEKIDDAKAAAR